MSRDAWCVLGAVLTVAGIALHVGLKWLPRHRTDRGK